MKYLRVSISAILISGVGAFAGDQDAETTTIKVSLPDGNAKVWFDGNLTRLTGTERSFYAPKLNPQVLRTYVVKASWMDNGREVVQEREVVVTQGRTTTVVFGFKNLTLTKGKPPALRVEYRHTHKNEKQGNECIFVLNGHRGHATYLTEAGKKKTVETLVFVRTDRIKNKDDGELHEGWVYKVQERNVWFLFPSRRKQFGGPTFQMFGLEAGKEWNDVSGDEAGTIRTVLDRTVLAPVRILTPQVLAQNVRVALDEEVVLMDAPQVSIGQGRLIVAYGDVLLPEPTHPIDYPIQLQFQIEMYRRLAIEKNAAKWWNVELRKWEALVAEQLDLVANGKGSNKVFEAQLKSAEKGLDDVFERWARDLKATFARISHKGPGVYRVQGETIPKGGYVYYISVFKHDLLADAADLSRWTRLPSEGADLGGNFFFGAEGPRGKIGPKERERITTERIDDRKIRISK